MKENHSTFSCSINKRQILIGTLGLLIGVFVYFVDRPPDQIYFLYKSGVNNSFYKILPNLFGPFGDSLPSFIHVFSFILITAGLLSSSKRTYIVVCVFWLTVDIAFEFGQKFTFLAIKMIPDWFAGIPFLENTENYFLYGAFDFIDLAGITIGTIIAYLVLLSTNKGQRREML